MCYLTTKSSVDRCVFNRWRIVVVFSVFFCYILGECFFVERLHVGLNCVCKTGHGSQLVAEINSGDILNRCCSIVTMIARMHMRLEFTHLLVLPFWVSLDGENRNFLWLTKNTRRESTLRVANKRNWHSSPEKEVVRCFSVFPSSFGSAKYIFKILMFESARGKCAFGFLLGSRKWIKDRSKRGDHVFALQRGDSFKWLTSSPLTAQRAGCLGFGSGPGQYSTSAVAGLCFLRLVSQHCWLYLGLRVF